MICSNFFLFFPLFLYADSIEGAVESIYDNIERGTEELRKGAEYQVIIMNHIISSLIKKQ